MVDRLNDTPKDKIHWNPAEDGRPEPLRSTRRRIVKGAIVVAAAGVTLCWAALLVWLLIKLLV
jgi:hypothetical protein